VIKAVYDGDQEATSKLGRNAARAITYDETWRPLRVTWARRRRGIRATSRPGTFNFDRLGVRVPAVLVSPFMTEGNHHRHRHQGQWSRTSIRPYVNLATARKLSSANFAIRSEPNEIATPELLKIVDMARPGPGTKSRFRNQVECAICRERRLGVRREEPAREPRLVGSSWDHLLANAGTSPRMATAKASLPVVP